MPIVMTYGFDWQEGRQVGDAFYEECAKTVTTTKAGGGADSHQPRRRK